MENIIDQLNKYKAKIDRKDHYEAVRSELEYRKNQLELKLPLLKKTMEVESKDVTKLEGHSFAALFYAVIGTKTERLNREKREALAAAAKYETVVCQLDTVETDLQKVNDELSYIEECRERYNKLLRERENLLVYGDTAEATEIMNYRNRISHFDAILKELNEAIDAGRKAQATASTIIQRFDKARGIGMNLGEVAFFDIAQHSSLYEAQRLMEQLQSQLLTFKSELADVEMSPEIKVSTDKLLLVADAFFDGFLGELAVREMIIRSSDNMKETYTQITAVIAELVNKCESLEQKKARARQRIDELVLRA